MRIVLFDVESAPNTCYTWGLHNQFIAVNQIKNPQRVMSWAAKVYGEKEMHYADETQRGGHKAMVKKLHSFLSDAHGIVSYNGVGFDNKMINAEFVKYGLSRLAPTKQIDLLKVVKKNFRFPSNKLQYVSKALGIGQKVQHQGFDLWVGCMEGDPKCWKKLEEYNKGDVLLLERLYDKLQPWLSNGPSHSLMSEARVCPECGSKHLQERGYRYTKTGKYKRLQCIPLGHWSSERVSTVDKDKRQNILVSL